MRISKEDKIIASKENIISNSMNECEACDGKKHRVRKKSKTNVMKNKSFLLRY